MIKFIISIALDLIVTALDAAQSTITVVEESVYIGNDKPKKQTGQAALAELKERAFELASTYIRS